jgi:hypothetical protein
MMDKRYEYFVSKAIAKSPSDLVPVYCSINSLGKWLIPYILTNNGHYHLKKNLPNLNEAEYLFIPLLAVCLL